MTHSTDRYTVLDAPQRSPEWRQARAGVLTASRAGEMLGRLKSGLPNQAHKDYLTQLVVERLTGMPQDEVYQTIHMQRGVDCEPLARADLEAVTGWCIDTPGMLLLRDLDAGASPDGMVGAYTIVEIKAAKSTTHMRYLRDAGGIRGRVPTEHLAQCRHSLWVSGCDSLEFVSWDDRFPDGLRLYRATLLAVDAGLPEYEADARKFLDDVAKEVETLREWCGIDDDGNAALVEVHGHGV